MEFNTAKEVYEKYLRYVEFKKQYDKLSTEDQIVLKSHLHRLFFDWRNALDSKKEKEHIETFNINHM